VNEKLFTKTYNQEDVSTIQSYGKTPLKIYCNHILTRHICIMKVKRNLWTNEKFIKRKKLMQNIIFCKTF